MIVVTALFGRLWCGWACPVGAAQDAIALIRKPKPQSRTIATYTRFGVLTATLLGLATGSTLLYILEPNTQLLRSLLAVFERFSTEEPTVPLSGSALLTLLVALSAWRRRFFCRYICPSGAILSLISLRAIFRVRINPSACKSCSACQRHCPTGAIKNGRVSQQACIACLECVAACPHNALSYAFKKGVRQISPITVAQRRRFLTMLAYGIIGGLLLGLLRPRTKLPRPPTAKKTLPAACIHCMACVAACPNRIIVPGPDMTPFLDFTKGNCEYRCLACGDVCPTEAINFKNLKQKWQTPIGVARIDHNLCLAHSGRGPCMGCQEVCPAEPENAIEAIKTEWGWEAPRVRESLCVGCGTCAFNCPADAIEVVP